MFVPAVAAPYLGFCSPYQEIFSCFPIGAFSGLIHVVCMFVVGLISESRPKHMSYRGATNIAML